MQLMPWDYSFLWLTRKGKNLLKHTGIFAQISAKSTAIQSNLLQTPKCNPLTVATKTDNSTPAKGSQYNSWLLSFLLKNKGCNSCLETTVSTG